MSAEPTRTAPYGSDLRWRIIYQRIAQGLSFPKIARNLNIAVGTAYNIFKIFQQTGGVNHKQQPRHERKLDNHHELYIIGLVLNDPTLWLSELVDKVQEISGTVVSVSTLCRLLASHGFTRKKIQYFALQRHLDLRSSYMANIYNFSKDMLVFVDESGSNLKDTLRQYGYSLCGDRAISHRLLYQGQRFSSIAAMCTEGVLAVSTITSAVNRDRFFAFVRGDLIPELVPFDGHSPKSVVIMDNCSVHRVQEVVDLFNNAGVLLLYLPPYSPDFNPIELLFGYVKDYLKDHECIVNAIPFGVLIQASFDSVTSSMCNEWIKHCGY